jgi:hypothetical protein
MTDPPLEASRSRAITVLASAISLIPASRPGPQGIPRYLLCRPQGFEPGVIQILKFVTARVRNSVIGDYLM